MPKKRYVKILIMPSEEKCYATLFWRHGRTVTSLTTNLFSTRHQLNLFIGQVCKGMNLLIRENYDLTKD